MDIKFTLDTTAMQAGLQKQLEDKMKNACSGEIIDFFNKRIERNYNKDTYAYDRHETKGDGLKQIDEMITNKFLDPKFQESMDRFFEHHWERIFEECMTRALQHKANGIAFNKMHTLPIDPIGVPK